MTVERMRTCEDVGELGEGARGDAAMSLQVASQARSGGNGRSVLEAAYELHPGTFVTPIETQQG